MSNSERTKKKALILFGLLFLVFGGGVSLYFMSSGIEDLKGFDKKSRFSYGFDFKKAVSPFFEILGFTDGEDTLGKSKPSLVGTEGFDDLYDGFSADSSAKSSSRASARIKNRDSRYRGPKGKLSSKNRGLKGGGKGRSKSSAGKSNFSRGTSKEDVNISQTGLAAFEKAESKRAYAAMKRTNNLLAQTHRTNSSMEAKSKWDKSFIGGGAAKGKMAYKGKGVELDELSSSVLDLKDGKEGTLAIPEVGAPEKDAAATAKDPALKALKDAANPMGGLVNSMFKSTTKGAVTDIGSGPNVPKISPEALAYANREVIPGEKAEVTAYSCATYADYCAENNIKGDTYYWATYEGQDGAPAMNMLFTSEGEDSGFVEKDCVFP